MFAELENCCAVCASPKDCLERSDNCRTTTLEAMRSCKTIVFLRQLVLAITV